MNQPDYREFYPKSLIPIGTNDKRALDSYLSSTQHRFHPTHWLVALQGRVKHLSENVYHWQVCLYPADLEGTYTWSKPYFVTSDFESIDQAIEMSRELETYGKDDAIISSNIQERIS
jgi:hypothetical protein